MRYDRYTRLCRMRETVAAGWAASDVHAIHPRPQYVGVRSTIRVQRQLQPLAGQVSGYIESASLGVAHEGDALILGQSPRRGQIALGCGQARADALDRLSVELRLLF